MTQIRIACIRAAAVALIALAPLAASAQAAGDAQVERLTGVLVQMLPFGKILDDAAAADPTWPLQGKAGKVDPAQLGCLRRELSSQGYQRSKRAEVAAYAQANPGRVGDDLKLLEGGAASVFGDFINAGVSEAQTGQKVEAADVIKKMKADQMLSFVEFISEPKHAPLRELVGIGDAFDPAKSAEQNSDAGKSIGARLVTKLMLGAMTTCNVSTSTIFE